MAKEKSRRTVTILLCAFEVALKNRAAVSFCEKQKPDDPHAISRGGILGGCRDVCVSGSQYP